MEKKTGRGEPLPLAAASAGEMRLFAAFTVNCEQPQELTCLAQGQRGVESVTIRNLTWPALPTGMYAVTFTTAFVLSFRFSGNNSPTLEL